MLAFPDRLEDDHLDGAILFFQRHKHHASGGLRLLAQGDDAAGKAPNLETANMEREVFRDILISEGFEEAVTVTREPDGFLGLHAHPFEAKALILSGELILNVQGAEQCYQAGQVFHLAAGTPHSEQYGPQGVEYLVGRR